jgi:hypothetical protein
VIHFHFTKALSKNKKPPQMQWLRYVSLNYEVQHKQTSFSHRDKLPAAKVKHLFSPPKGQDIGPPQRVTGSAVTFRWQLLSKTLLHSAMTEITIMKALSFFMFHISGIIQLNNKPGGDAWY